MPDSTPADRRPTRPYSVSLQQAAAAIFGVAIIDGDRPAPRRDASKHTRITR